MHRYSVRNLKPDFCQQRLAGPCHYTTRVWFACCTHDLFNVGHERSIRAHVDRWTEQDQRSSRGQPMGQLWHLTVFSTSSPVNPHPLPQVYDSKLKINSTEHKLKQKTKTNKQKNSDKQGWLRVLASVTTAKSRVAHIYFLAFNCCSVASKWGLPRNFARSFWSY